MQLKFIFVITCAVAIHAETPVSLYAPAGWRPQVPFNLPGEFGDPVGSSVQITRARVEHAGTFNEPQVNPNYLPPKFDNSNQQPVAQPESTELPTGEQQTTPAAEYGAPNFRINYPEEDESAASLDLQQNFREGRYYIVSSNNKLQRVLYRTTEDKTGDGFTAQLRYSPVGELHDPVYKYNSLGQLERVLK
ncbi:uncharacterized protein LOC6559878 [Drosophila grimshawi]|uniref:uncharacterized protein LOC6559878 n=1 Tax=Drosophila grimshawi TaxID=7222 RepID=UPI000C86F982|nr:uncharacterized protein LOC6559878 [Drosophila grimshawi]